MWAVSDDALLAGLATGDPDAAAAFIRRFQRRVYGLAITICRDPGVAEDVAQETFARAWRHASTYDSRRGLVAAWLLAITRNLAIDTMRPRRPEPTDPESIVAMQLVAPGLEPSEQAAQADAAARLRAAIALLPTEQRRSLVLAAFYGRSAREISEFESIPIGTAKTRIRSAMLKLRAAMLPERELE